MMDTLRHLHNPLCGNSRPVASALPQEPATRELDLEELIKHLALNISCIFESIQEGLLSHT
jgi:hypothetical protein